MEQTFRIICIWNFLKADKYSKKKKITLEGLCFATWVYLPFGWVIICLASSGQIIVLLVRE
jgi:hypothetical protein